MSSNVESNSVLDMMYFLTGMILVFSIFALASVEVVFYTILLTILTIGIMLVTDPEIIKINYFYRFIGLLISSFICYYSIVHIHNPIKVKLYGSQTNIVEESKKEEVIKLVVLEKPTIKEPCIMKSFKKETLDKDIVYCK